eukprot:642775-Rhodomonas_salina.1
MRDRRFSPFSSVGRWSVFEHREYQKEEAESGPVSRPAQLRVPAPHPPASSNLNFLRSFPSSRPRQQPLSAFNSAHFSRSNTMDMVKLWGGAVCSPEAYSGLDLHFALHRA